MLEVIALNVQDALAAQQGGAERIELVGTMDLDGLSPSLELVEAIAEEVGIPQRVMLRTEGGFGTTQLDSLIQLAEDYSAAGVDGIVFGYLNNGCLDLDVMRTLAEHISVPVTIHRAVDHAEDYQQALDAALRLPGNVTSILSGGGAAGVGENLHNLEAIPAVLRPKILVGGGLKEGHVLKLRELGFSNFHVGSAVRPEGSFAQPVDPARVAAWVELTSGVV